MKCVINFEKLSTCLQNYIIIVCHLFMNDINKFVVQYLIINN